MASLKLGVVDAGKKPADLDAYFKMMHGEMYQSINRKAFRNDGRWFQITEDSGNQVAELQNFLHEKGFMPFNPPNGIYDYVTMAAVRLFQEYVRTIEGDASIGTPDGWAGRNEGQSVSNTWKHVKRWQQNNVVNEWATSSVTNPSPEYTKWINLLNAAKRNYVANKHPILKMIENHPHASDTRKVENWDFGTDKVHVIGIRRKQDVGFTTRKNDDIFVLLINGMVFKFWGSTDPSSRMTDRDDEAFLVEGQHEYRFGFHKRHDINKVYKALRPATKGVLVFRDRDSDNALTETDIKKGLEGPNNTINIHWSGIGSFNFSAGCQVVAGESYINNRDEVVSCGSFASKSYVGLNVGKTKGAYNVCADLILALTQTGTRTILYTLGREENLNLDATLGKDYASQTLIRMINA